MIALNDLAWFTALAETLNFTRAAARLGVSQSTLSHRIREIETSLGLRLFNRTTRAVALTEAGERLYRAVQPRLAEIGAEVEALTALSLTPAGRIRLTLSDHALGMLWPRLETFLRQTPEVAVEFSLDNGFVEIVEEGFDAGIRLGESLAADMVAVRVSPDWQLLTVAAPDYLARRGRPAHPRDLIGHDCINHRQRGSGGLYVWEFAEEVRVKVTGQLTFTSSLPMVQAAVAGLGIGYVPQDLVAAEIASGRLVSILEEWCPSFPGYHLYYPTRRANLPAFRALVEALRLTSSASPARP